MSGFLGTGSLKMARCAATLLLSIGRFSGLSIASSSCADGNVLLLFSGLVLQCSPCCSTRMLSIQLRDASVSASLSVLLHTGENHLATAAPSILVPF